MRITLQNLILLCSLQSWTKDNEMDVLILKALLQILSNLILVVMALELLFKVALLSKKERLKK